MVLPCGRRRFRDRFARARGLMRDLDPTPGLVAIAGWPIPCLCSCTLRALFVMPEPPRVSLSRSGTGFWDDPCRCQAPTFIRKVFAVVFVPRALGDLPHLPQGTTSGLSCSLVSLVISCFLIKAYGEVHVDIRGSSHSCTGKFTDPYGEVHIPVRGSSPGFHGFPMLHSHKRTGKFTSVRP